MSVHPTREEDFDLYALGALEGEDKRAIESHLAGCSVCMQKLAEARGRVALLALAAPVTAPSSAVKHRLLRQVRSDAKAGAPRDTAAESRSVARSTAVSRSGLGGWWNVALIPAAAALAVVAIFLWSENRQLARELAAVYDRVAQQQQQLTEARQAASLLALGDTITIPLAQQPGMPAGSAHVSYNAKTGTLMYDGALAPAPASKSYQLWLVPVNGKPISAGAFNPVPGLPDHWIITLPAGTVPKEFAVSLEPAGGMPQPTGPMVLVGPVS